MAASTGARIVSASSIIVDMSLRVPAMPVTGGDVIAAAPLTGVGGGYNLLYAAARQGARVAYAGRCGAGPRGRLVGQALRQLGVTALLPPSAAGDTGLCITFVDSRAERTFVTAPGAEATLALSQLQGIELQDGDLIALSGYDLVYAGAVQALVEWVSSLPAGLPVLLDPGPPVLDIPPAAWARVLPALAVLTVNEREARLLAGDSTADLPSTAGGTGDSRGSVALHALVRRRHPLRPDALLVIRHGADGCTFDGGPGRAAVTPVPAMKVTALDTTGAGDTHAGVFLAERAAGASIAPALRRACIAAAISATLPGPATAPAPAEIDQAIAWAQSAGGEAWPGFPGQSRKERYGQLET